jgi:hypothetical protein
MPEPGAVAARRRILRSDARQHAGRPPTLIDDGVDADLVDLETETDTNSPPVARSDGQVYGG